MIGFVVGVGLGGIEGGRVVCARRRGNVRVHGMPKAPVDDASVPEGHRGLHDLLYKDGAEAEHGRAGLDDDDDINVFDQDEIYEVEEALEMIGQSKLAGVYAVRDADRGYQHIGISRNIGLNLKAHLAKLGPETVAYVQIESVQFPSRDDLETIRNEWIEDIQEVPPGNGKDYKLWSLSAKQASAVVSDPDAKMEYEDKRNKLQKAMGEVSRDDDAALSGDSMRSAVEDGDWSAVVNEQTQETIQTEQVISPFADKGAEVAAVRTKRPMTLENCNEVLDEVRPYLVADGGNVKVLTVEEGAVKVLLEGACGSCPSSTTTMKMGIEKVLRDNFDEFQSVEAVSDVADALGGKLSIELCDHTLDQVRPAIVGLGGVVNVVEAGGEEIVLHYTGPEKLAYGIELMLRDKFPEVREIRFDG